jgi:segregation and condensation protein A
MSMIRLKNVSKFYYSKGIIASGISRVNLDLDAGEFVVMAATLMLIKSRMLLPVDERADAADDDAEPIDPRLDLVRQLVEYKRYKDAANTFAQREVLRAATYPKGAAPD